jgi:hypothetical protein
VVASIILQYLNPNWSMRSLLRFARIEKFASDKVIIDVNADGIGFVKYVEREPELVLDRWTMSSQRLRWRRNFTFDQHWLTSRVIVIC